MVVLCGNQTQMCVRVSCVRVTDRSKLTCPIPLPKKNKKNKIRPDLVERRVQPEKVTPPE